MGSLAHLSSRLGAPDPFGFGVERGVERGVLQERGWRFVDGDGADDQAEVVHSCVDLGFGLPRAAGAATRRAFMLKWAHRVGPTMESVSEWAQARGGGLFPAVRVSCPGWDCSLLARGVAASSCDAPDQDIGRTLDDCAETFWSSSGSSPREGPRVPLRVGREDGPGPRLEPAPEPGSEPEPEPVLLASPGPLGRGAAYPRGDFETLTYQFRGPCELRAVAVSFFRAEFQMGAPVYPSEWVEVLVGSSRATLQPVGPRTPVRASSELQILPVQPPVVCAGLLQLRLVGKPQRQLEDGQRYVAVGLVRAVGRLLTPLEVLHTERALRQVPRPFGDCNWEGHGAALDARLLSRSVPTCLHGSRPPFELQLLSFLRLTRRSPGLAHERIRAAFGMSCEDPPADWDEVNERSRLLGAAIARALGPGDRSRASCAEGASWSRRRVPRDWEMWNGSRGARESFEAECMPSRPGLQPRLPGVQEWWDRGGGHTPPRAHHE